MAQFRYILSFSKFHENGRCLQKTPLSGAILVQIRKNAAKIVEIRWRIKADSGIMNKTITREERLELWKIRRYKRGILNDRRKNNRTSKWF